MNRQKRVKTAVAAVLALGLGAGSNAFAENTGWYFGLSGGAGSVDLADKATYDAFFQADMAVLLSQNNAGTVEALDVSTLDDSTDVWGVHIGYRWNRFVAAEVGYLNLGEATYQARFITRDALGQVRPVPAISDVRYTSDGPFANVLGMLPLGERFDLHGRAGIYMSDTRFRLRSRLLNPDPTLTLTSHMELRSDTIELMAGVGATWNINASYSLRVEYQRLFDVGDDEDGIGESDVDLFSLAVLFR